MTTDCSLLRRSYRYRSVSISSYGIQHGQIFVDYISAELSKSTISSIQCCRLFTSLSRLRPPLRVLLRLRINLSIDGSCCRRSIRSSVPLSIGNNLISQSSSQVTVGCRDRVRRTTAKWFLRIASRRIEDVRVSGKQSNLRKRTICLELCWTLPCS